MKSKEVVNNDYSQEVLIQMIYWLERANKDSEKKESNITSISDNNGGRVYL